MIETKVISMGLLEPNRGQIEGLPKNPRFIRDAKFEKLKKSIEDNPEMLSLRELLVVEYKATQNRQKYVVVGGNMRHKAMADIGYTEAVCKVLPQGTPIERLKAYVIKDNGSFGEWDFDELANAWDEVVDLEEYGVDISAWKVKEQDFEGGGELDLDDFDEEMTLNIKVSENTLKEIKDGLARVNSSPEMALLIVAGWNDGE